MLFTMRILFTDRKSRLVWLVGERASATRPYNIAALTLHMRLQYYPKNVDE